MQEIAALESHVVSGAVFKDAVPSPPARPSCLDQLSSAVRSSLERLERLASPAGPVERQHSARLSRKDRARGRVTLRLRVSAGVRDHYRWLERLFERHGPRGVSFMRFLCASLVETWRHALGSDGAYAQTYARDAYRCTSPVCTRRDVTPHHLRFRSVGGDDSRENLTSLCTWCHLKGIHGGRLRATPPASQPTWTLGQKGHEHTVVHGRRRGAARPRGVLAAHGDVRPRLRYPSWIAP